MKEQKQQQDPYGEKRNQRILDKLYKMIVDEDSLALTEEGMLYASQLGIKLEDILNKTIEEFKVNAPSEDIAKIRYDHFQLKRRKKLMKINDLITAQQRNADAFNNTHADKFQQSRIVNDISLANKSFFNMKYQPITSHSIMTKDFEKSNNKKQQLGTLSFPITSTNLAQQKKGNADNEAQKVMAVSSNNALVNSASLDMSKRGRATFMNNTGYSPESPFMNSFSANLINLKALNESSMQQYRSNGKMPSENSIKTAQKFIKARLNAEQEAKKHIDKLNDLIKKREQKEKKMKEALQDKNLERQMLLGKYNEKRDVIRARIEKAQKDQEQRSMKNYSSSLKQLEERQMSVRQKEREKSTIEHSRILHNDSKLSLKRKGSTILSNSLDEEQLSAQLKLLDDRLQKGLERSALFKQQLSTHAAKLSEKHDLMIIKSKEQQQQQEKWTNYLLKRKKLEDKLKQYRQDQLLQLQMLKQTKEEKDEQKAQVKKSLDRSVDNRFKVYEQKLKSSEKQIEENKRKLKLEKMKRDELWHLRHLDQKDTLEEMKMKIQQEKFKVLQGKMSDCKFCHDLCLAVQKHQLLTYQQQTQQQEMRIWDELRHQKEEERRKFMQSRISAKPYEEMKYRFLSQAALTPDIRKGKDKTIRNSLNFSALH